MWGYWCYVLLFSGVILQLGWFPWQWCVEGMVIHFPLHILILFMTVVTNLNWWIPGVADIIGRRYGSIKIPYNQKKSWAGSISMFIFGFLVSIGCVTLHANSSIFSTVFFFLLIRKWTQLREINVKKVIAPSRFFETETVIFIACRMLYYYSALGHVEFNWENTLPRVAFISVVATVVESLPITEVIDDNISVPLVTMAVAFFIFNH